MPKKTGKAFWAKWWLLIILTTLIYRRISTTMQCMAAGMYLKERNFRVGLFSRVIFLTFRVDLISRIGYQRVFHKDLFSWILVLSVFYIFWFFSWFAFQPNFSIFPTALFGYNRLNSQLNAWNEIKRADIIKGFKFFFLCCLHLYCLISCKIFLTLSSLIDKET